MPHRNSRPTTGRRERGAVAVELAMLLPLLLAMVLFSVQVGMWFYARSIALSAAEEGARTSAARTSSLDAGLTTARQFAAAAGANGLTSVSITGSRSATSTTVHVSGTAVRLVPFLPMTLTVTQSATLPVERLT